MSSESNLERWYKVSALTKLSGFSLRIGVAGEYSKETGGLLWKGKALEGDMPKLAGEFNEVAGEVSNLRCLMNTLN